MSPRHGRFALGAVLLGLVLLHAAAFMLACAGGPTAPRTCTALRVDTLSWGGTVTAYAPELMGIPCPVKK